MEQRHGKMCLKVFVVVIPKEDWARPAIPAIHSFGTTPTIEHNLKRQQSPIL